MKVSSELLLQYVYQDLSDVNTSNRPEARWFEFSARALQNGILSKMTEHVQPDADSRALDKFLSVNENLPNLPLVSDLYDDYLLGELRKELDRFWYSSGDQPLVGSLHQLFLLGKTGPGKSIGSEFNDAYCKLHQSKLSTTSPELYKSYRASVSTFPLTDASEKLRAEEVGEFDVVRHSKLLFVPKRTDISRTICVEPSLNMFYQLGLAQVLEERLRQVYSIDLTKQPDLNRELTRLGSVDGSYATIDLSSASDSFSIGVLRDILPRGFFSWLMSLRTPSVKLPDGRVIALKMISTMGNGFTFPLETLVFAAIVSVCYRLSGVQLLRNQRVGDRWVPGNFGVFGDDIIVESRIFSKVKRLLTCLGFKVNDSKTFVEGPFRESCGHDYFCGHFVRSVYIKTLRTPQDRYVAINMLNNWSAESGISLPRTVRYLLRSVRKVFVPPTEGYDAGIHVPFSMIDEPRYGKNRSVKYRSFKPIPRVHRIAEDGSIKQRSHLIVNPYGLIISFVSGHVRSQAITLRQRATRYVMKPGISPNWDYFPFARSNRRFSFTQWGTAVYFNSWG